MLAISQRTFAEQFADEYRLNYDKRVPLPVGKRLEEVEEDEAPADRPFRELVGCLMWSSTQTRPNISNTARAVARYCFALTPVQRGGSVCFLRAFETDELIRNYV